MNNNLFKQLVSSFQDFSRYAQKGIGKKSTQKVHQEFDIGEYLKIFSCFDVYFYVVADSTQLKLVKIGGALEQMTGYKPEDFEGKSYHKLLKIHSLKDMIRAAKGGSVYFKYLYSQPPEKRYYIKVNRTVDIKCCDGSKIHCLTQSIPIAFNENMEPVYFLNVITDISKIKHDNTYTHYILDSSDENEIKNIPVHTLNEIEPKTEGLISMAELKVLRLLAQGNSSKQIAGILFLSEHTVKNHRKSMLKKYECTSSAELVRMAIMDGII